MQISETTNEVEISAGGRGRGRNGAHRSGPSAFSLAGSSGMLSMRLQQTRLLFPAAGPLNYYHRYVWCVIALLAFANRSESATLPRTHPAHTMMPFCLMSNRGLPLQTLPFLFFLFPSPSFPPSATHAYAIMNGWQHPVSRNHPSG